MRTLNIELENCYGIKKLKHQFDFSQQRTYAIYASNGSMKSSLAQTFQDVADGTESKDRVHQNRKCSRHIIDENGVDLPEDNIFVIRPYHDEDLSHTEKTSTLLVNNKLRKEYEQLHIEIDKTKAKFLDVLKEQSGSRKDLEKEISLAFTPSDGGFYKALNRIEGELLDQKDTPFANISYDTIFDERVLILLETKDFKAAIADYIKKYNELLAASTYFKKGIFNYYNAATIAKNLADNGFFDAKHTVNFNADETLLITSRKQLEELIEKEKEGISSDRELRKKFAAIDKQLQKNVSVKKFRAYLEGHDEILSQLENIENFKEEIWKSYIGVHIALYKDLISKYRKAEQRKKEIEKKASSERTQWERVIEIFNDRFIVPFRLTPKNRVSVILGQEPLLTLGFTFDDGSDKVPLEKDELMKVLSTGELRAFYVLNIIFEVEARKKARQETVFIIDDIADSFDYKNKYAIIQYLQDISAESYFYQIVLTHNFDFFRTINSRFIGYKNCLMASRRSDGITIAQAKGIRNIFVNDWKPNFFNDPKKKIASIPFIRNIIEYTTGEKDERFIKLTSLLHWKADTSGITQDELDNIYTSVFGTNGSSVGGKNTMIDIIKHEANECLNAADGINFENKIILSIAIRIAAEKFMVDKINDPEFVASIKLNQTSRLQVKFKELFGSDQHAIKTIQRVMLMIPDNIHMNSFMYEPILDMSEDHLKKLYKDVMALA